MAKTSLRFAPHPLREFLFLFILSFATAFVLTIFTQGIALRIATISLGLSSFMYGGTVFMNVNGAADYYAVMSSERKWLGIDYAGSAYVRLYVIRGSGVLFAIVGVLLSIGGLLGPL